VLTTVAHEVYHILAANVDRELADKTKAAEADKEAEEFSVDALIKLAKRFDLEPPPLDAEPFFGPRIMELVLKKGMSAAQIEQMENGMIYEDAVNGIVLSSFRNYVRGLVDPEKADEAWELPTVGVSVTYTMADGTHVEQVPVADKVVDPTPVPVVAPVEEPLAAMTASAADTVLVETPEAGQTFRVNQEEICEEDYGVGALLDEAISAQKGQAQATVPAWEEQPSAPVMQQQVMQPTQQPLPPSAVPASSFKAQVMNAGIPAPQVAMAPAPVLTATQYPRNGLGMAQMKPCAEELFQALASVFFLHCGWQRNNGGGFTQPLEVLKQLDVSAILRKHGCEGFLMEYKTFDANGQVVYEKCTNGIVRGFVTPKVNIPAYEICLNIDGIKTTRAILAQNPNKLKFGTQELSAPAVDARNGVAIAWIKDVDDSNPKNHKFRYKFVNGALQVLS